MEKGKLIIFSAPSGAGKTTIVKHLLNAGLNLEFSISAASRKIRSNEVDGKDYYFLTVDEFKNRINANAFLEWEEVYADHFYGTFKSEVERIRNKGNHVIFDVDVIGGLNLKKYFGEEALAVFVVPPHIEELEKRLRGRSTENEVTLKKRLEKAEHELSFADEFDFQLINDNLERAKEQAVQLVKEFIGSYELSVDQ
jgi:guanylate kinase